MLIFYFKFFALSAAFFVACSQIFPASNAVFQAEPKENELFHSTSECVKLGDQYVNNYILYECYGSKDDATTLIAKPIGCVPTNRLTGSAILPGATHTSIHFRYECQRDANNTILLKVTHCVDNSGKLVKIGDFFTESLNQQDESVGSNSTNKKTINSASIECVGDEFLAKKIVHKWSKCRLKNGETLIEGNFITVNVENDLLRTSLQKSEIISCVRDGDEVLLKCTGCVSSTGVDVGITNYLNVEGQWTQCRRFKDGCRLINISRDYIDCEYNGKKILNGASFQSESGLSSFYCSNGAVIKKGCLLNKNLILVGEVRYVNEQPLLCEQSDQLTAFGGLIGCDLSDGTFKRFMETWRNKHVMKRCSWNRSQEGVIKSHVISFACLDGTEIIPLNKIVQRKQGDFFKCAPVKPNLKTSTTLSNRANRFLNETKLNSAAYNEDLEMRTVNPKELASFIKKKRLKLNLIEYFGVGAKSIVNETTPDKEKDNMRALQREKQFLEDNGNKCQDLLPFCSRLIDYCNFAQKDSFFESGLAIDSSLIEFRDVQTRFEKLIGTPDGESSNRPTQHNECEDQLTPFQKFQVLVQIACAKTCEKCSTTIDAIKEKLISHLERTAHCG